MLEIAGEFGNGNHSLLFQPFVAENVKVFLCVCFSFQSVTVFLF